MHSLGLKEPLREAEPLLKQDLSHGELDKHKFKKLSGTFVASNKNMTKWRSAGAYCCFLFLTLIYSSLATHDKDFLKRPEKKTNFCGVPTEEHNLLKKLFFCGIQKDPFFSI